MNIAQQSRQVDQLAAAGPTSELDGELAQLQRSVNALGAALETLGNRLFPITSQYLTGAAKANVDKEVPRPAPSCQVVGQIAGINDAISAMVAMVSQQTGALAI